MGGSVIWLDIPRDTVSVDCNIKSTRGHTSIQLTPWESKAQYKRWNQETYKLHTKASHLMKFHAAERRARSIRQSRCLSLHHMAHIGWICPSHRNGPHQDRPAGYRTYHDEEDALVHHNLQRSGRLEDMPEDDGAGSSDRPAGSLRDPPAEDPQGSGKELMLELIDLGKGEETLTPSQPKKADCPTMLQLHEKMATTSEKLPAFSFPPLQDHIKTLPAPTLETCPEEVPEEQIIYIDDDVVPTPLQLLKSQVDSLLMPPPSDMTPMAQKSLGRDQLSRMPERRKCSPGNTRKKTLQERQNAKSLKLKVGPVAKMHTRPVDTLCTQELVKLTSVVVPLQRLKIQDDSLLEDQKNKPEAEAPAPPQK